VNHVLNRVVHRHKTRQSVPACKARVVEQHANHAYHSQRFDDAGRQVFAAAIEVVVVDLVGCDS
jgi:hypothetical protein